ncbi:hypothetical protein Q7A53_21115 [Halobacillus rhizosphaerae]|uniref:ABC-three component system protein n=1 Tax=Halobacillus rhizosphaerae TaxID=3064889 RepID=UPI00398AEAB3
MGTISNKYLEKSVCRLTCGEGNDCDKATGFLISPDLAVTATHAIEEYFLEQKEIRLEFLNIDNKPIIRTALPLESTKEKGLPVSILQLDESVNYDVHISFSDYKAEKDDSYETYGYPTVKWDVGQWTKSHVSRRINPDMTQTYDWDIDLNHQSNIGDFRGLSGAPLFIDQMLVGVVLTQSSSEGKAISLGSISVQKLKSLLDEANVSVKKTSEELVLDEIYELDETMDYSEAMFVTKLELAGIFDNEDCQQEFFNADILKSTIESRGIDTETKRFAMLTHNVKSVWKNKYRPYKDEKDGNELLSQVYTRIEDLDKTTLSVKELDIPLLVKKGILHQLSDECEVGWTKNYLSRLKEYLLEKGQKDD